MFQSLLSGRTGLGIDVNPVAVCVSRAKAQAPLLREIHSRIDEFEASFDIISQEDTDAEFFRLCFHEETLSQILWLKSRLDWRGDPVDCFIAAMVVGCLHGESHRSARVLSNRMPRTISTKPAYSVGWWKANDCSAPKRNAFGVLRAEADYRYESERPINIGFVKEGDARLASHMLEGWSNRVDMIITSPPYLDVTHFREDQWLRVWFLGGPAKPCSAKGGDDRHWTEERYWRFLEESWLGVAPLMKDSARIVVRIGGRKLNIYSAQKGLERTLERAFSNVTCREAIVSEIKRGQLRAFRPNATGTSREFDFTFDVSH